MQTWTALELGRFLQGVQSDRLYATWHVLATTGMRRGEALGIRWSDVDLDAGRLSIQQTVICLGYKVTFSEPKTKRGRRSIALDAETVAVLKAHKKAQLEERVALGLGKPDASGLVFTQTDGSPINPSWFSDSFRSHVKALGLKEIRLHDLRHTYATMAFGAGVPAKVVSDRLGHSTVAFTLDRYSHHVPALDEEAAEKVAGLIPAMK